MEKYIVIGYAVTSYSVEVEAKNESEAYDLGEDLLMRGAGAQGDTAWQDDFEVLWEAH